MKKWLMILLACAFALTLNVKYAFAYPTAVAAISNYNDAGLASRITISRANGKPPGSEILLYPNDRITGDINAVKFNVAPYTSIEKEGSTCVIRYNPPTAWERTKDEALDMLNSFLRSVEVLTYGSSRGSGDSINASNLVPQPGYVVTLLSGQKVTFSWWSSKNKTFFITDDKGKKVFEKDISGMTSIELDLSAKLQTGKQYFWSVDGNPKNCKITKLDKKKEKEILSRLKEIDADKNLSENARILRKVNYVQLISDIYPEQIDLYWLSAQWLLDFKATTEEDLNYQQFLLEQCSNHLTNKAP